MAHFTIEIIPWGGCSFRHNEGAPSFPTFDWALTFALDIDSRATFKDWRIVAHDDPMLGTVVAWSKIQEDSARKRKSAVK